MSDGAPVFIKIDKYKDVLEIMSVLRSKISQARKTLDKINSLKDMENEEIAAWKSSLDDIEKRVEGVDTILFEPDNL